MVGLSPDKLSPCLAFRHPSGGVGARRSSAALPTLGFPTRQHKRLVRLDDFNDGATSLTQCMRGKIEEQIGK